MNSHQTDLLEHLAQVEAETIVIPYAPGPGYERVPGDLVCPHCHHQTQGTFEYSINHAPTVRDLHTGDTICISMELTRNHVIEYLRQTPATHSGLPDREYKRKDVENAITRAVDTWGHRAQTFIPAYQWPTRKNNE